MYETEIKTIKEVYDFFNKKLKKNLDERESETISYLLTEYFFDADKNDVLLNDGFVEIDDDLRKELYSCIKCIQEGEPVQYVLGESWFYGNKYFVNPSVLIPRPETEELVHEVIKHAKQLHTPSIIDLGTGSGCIAISLALELPESIVTAIDISDRALEVAQDNAQEMQATLTFNKCDILDITSLPAQEWDIIVSNPPYVADSEKTLMHTNVLDHEPHLALFVPDSNPLLYYQNIAEYAHRFLKEKGLVMVEINERFGNETSLLFKNKGFSQVEIMKDIHGKDRFVKAIK